MSEAMKFRKKKPVVIEAMQWDGSPASAGEVIDWVLRRPTTATPSYYETNETEHRNHAELHIPTLEGVMVASPGDWIIIGVSNEVYPCKPGIFEATYEAVIGDE